MNYLLDFRIADVGGAVAPGMLVRGNGLGSPIDLKREPKLTFLVHGFNVSRQSGALSLQRLAANLASPGIGAFVGVLWPGDHWIGPISFPFEGHDADDSAAALVKFIAEVIAPGTELSFVTHSLGARVALETVRRLKPQYPVTEMCVMAAAIDDDSVSDSKVYRRAVSKARRVAVLASRSDQVLKLAYPVGDLLESLFFGNNARFALGYQGPRPADGDAIPAQVLREQIPDARGSDHSDYFPSDMPNNQQRSAVRFARDVLQGEGNPHYI